MPVSNHSIRQIRYVLLVFRRFLRILGSCPDRWALTEQATAGKEGDWHRVDHTFGSIPW